MLGKNPAALRLLCAVLTALVGCRKPAVSYRSYASVGKAFTCEVPSSWDELPPDLEPQDDLYIRSPDYVNEISAHLAIYPREQKETRESLEAYVAWLRKHWAHHKNFEMEPLTTVQVGEFTGLTYSLTRMERSTDPHRAPPDPPPVPYKETHVHFETLGGSYEIDYEAPTELYEKHRPTFEHLLKTFRWTKPAGKGNK